MLEKYSLNYKVKVCDNAQYTLSFFWYLSKCLIMNTKITSVIKMGRNTAGYNTND